MKENIFTNVEVLIYVLDVTSKESEDDLKQFASCLEAL